MKAILVGLLLVSPVMVVAYQTGLDAQQIADGIFRVVRTMLVAAF